MKNWLATANFMYRQVLVKSLASSASFVVVRTICGTSVRKSGSARSPAARHRRRRSAEACAALRARGLRRSARGRTRRRPGSLVPRDAGGRSRSCPGRPCFAGPQARRREGAARSGRPSVRRSSSTGRGTHRPASRRRRSVGWSATITSRPTPTRCGLSGRSSRSRTSAPVSRNGISPARDPVEGGAVGVVDPDAEAGLRERETQWESDVSATSEDDDVEFLVSHRGDSSRADAVLPLPEGPKPFG